MTNNNLEIYNAFRSVPQEAQKKIQAGKLKGFTDINPMWRIKRLTETFGMCGEGWTTEDVRFWTETAGGETAMFCSLNLKVMRGDYWSDPIFGIGGSKLAGKGVGDGINDEACKMAYTDALSIACKNLGMCADIYFEKDRTKYDITPDQPTNAVQTRKAVKDVSGYQPMAQEHYWKVVECYAKGIPTKTGGDYRQTWIETTHAGKAEIAKFDEDVDNYVNAQMATDPFPREQTSQIQDI